jgi:hypothetical protein
MISVFLLRTRPYCTEGLRSDDFKVSDSKMDPTDFEVTRS